MSTPKAEAVALEVLRTLISQVGAEWVSQVVELALGGGAGAVLEDLSTLGYGIMQAILNVLEPELVKSTIAASYASANAAADAAIAAKFPKDE